MTGKQPPYQEAFPWKCRICHLHTVYLEGIEYQAEVLHDNILCRFTVPSLLIPICTTCGEKSFTGWVDEQINESLRSYLRLLTPAQIELGMETLNLTPYSLATRLGVESQDVAGWINRCLIQSKALDCKMREFFHVSGILPLA